MQTEEDAVGDETGTCLNESGKKELRVIDVVGGHGPWQYRHWAIFFLATLCTSLHLFSTLPLMTISSPCNCFNVSSENKENGQKQLPICNISNCETSEYRNPWNELGNLCIWPFPKTSKEHSSEDDLECTNGGIVFYAKCLFVIGSIVSCFITYPLIKRFGRRSVSLMSCFLLSSCSFAGIWAFAPGPYLMLKLILSMNLISVYLISAFSLANCVSDKFRLFYFYTGQIAWGSAHFILPLIIWIFPSWTMFNVIITIPCFLLLIILCFLPETAESYAARGLMARAHKVIRNAARCNGHSLQRVEQCSPNFLLTQTNDDCDTDFVFNLKNYRCLLEQITLFIIGFFSSFIYFTSIWLTDWLSKKRNSYFSLMGTTEVAAVLVVLFFSYFIPFRRLWSLTTCMCSLLLIIMFIREKKDVPKLSRSTFIIEMFFASASWTSALLHFLNQPLPSKKARFRMLVVAMGFCIGFLGHTLTELQKLHAWNRHILLIMGVSNLILGICIGVIPSKYLDNF